MNGKVRRAALALAYPMLEYDFHNDRTNADLPIDLKPMTKVRPTGHGPCPDVQQRPRAVQASSCPCGAGKTLVGILRDGHDQEATLVCAPARSPSSRKAQYQFFCRVPDRLKRFTSQVKEPFDPSQAVVCLTTYSMLTHSGKRSAEAAQMLRISRRSSGAPPDGRGTSSPPRCSVASSASPSPTASWGSRHPRAGGLPHHRPQFLDRPKPRGQLDGSDGGEVSGKSAVRGGVVSDDPGVLPRDAAGGPGFRQKQAFYTMNYNKFRACEFLIKYHEDRGDKILVFSDHVFALKRYAEKMRRCIIYGATSQIERLRVLDNFRHSPLVNTLFISKVGDVAIDLPEATVIIQISTTSGPGGRRRSGWGIPRPKQGMTAGFNAFFYADFADTPRCTTPTAAAIPLEQVFQGRREPARDDGVRVQAAAGKEEELDLLEAAERRRDGRP